MDAQLLVGREVINLITENFAFGAVLHWNCDGIRLEWEGEDRSQVLCEAEG